MFTIIGLIFYIWVAHWIAVETHSDIFGWAAFFIMLPSIKYVLAVDVTFGLFNLFNRKADERAEKIMQSQRFITKEQMREIMRIKELKEKRYKDLEDQMVQEYLHREALKKEIQIEDYKIK